MLRSHGRWAGWWSHAHADAEDWFDRYWSAIELTCPGTDRGQRDVDWGARVAASGLFEVGDPVVVPWRREVSIDDWLTDQTSHSYVDQDLSNATNPSQRPPAVSSRHFLDGTMQVAYETWLWIGRKT